jgi:hypothetical protein
MMIVGYLHFPETRSVNMWTWLNHILHHCSIFFLTLSWVKQSKTIGKPQSVGSQKHVKTWTILVTQGSQSFCRKPCPVVLPGPAPRSPDASSDRTISWLWKTIKVVPHLTFGGYGKRLYIIYINRTSGVKLNKHNWGTTFGCYHLLS